MSAVKLRSKYPGQCKTCGGNINVGDFVFWTPGKKGASHTQCPDLSLDTTAIKVKTAFSLAEPGESDQFPGLFVHQQEIVNTLRESPNEALYLAFDAGLGKTYTSLAAAEASNSFPLIVICPSVVKINWQRETERWIGKEAQILKGRTPYEIDSDVVIINYEVLDAWQDTLIELGAKGLVCDESHKLKNKAAKRTKAALAVAEKIDGMKLLLSGTPTPNSVYDLVAPLKIMGVLDRFGGEKKFVNRYCPPMKTRYGVSHARATNTKELHGNLKAVGFVRRRREDCLDLPEKIRVEIPLDTKVETNIQFYKPFLREMKAGTLKEAKRVLQKGDRDLIYEEFLRERQAVGLAKVPSIVELAESFNEPTVIMVHHKEVVEQLMKKLKSFKPVKLVGGMSAANRQESIDSFQGGKTDLMIASITAAGVGINLQRGTQMIIGELPWTYADLEQAESRCHRAGAKNDLTVHKLMVQNSSDELHDAVISKKWANSAAVEDGESLDSVDPSDAVARKLLWLYRNVPRRTWA